VQIVVFMQTVRCW